MYISEKKRTFVQCQHCGALYQIQRKLPVDAFYIESECPDCGYNVGLNCGESKEDVYELININLDQRFYRY